jgi:hypothetical protein
MLPAAALHGTSSFYVHTLPGITYAAELLHTCLESRGKGDSALLHACMFGVLLLFHMLGHCGV